MHSERESRIIGLVGKRGSGKTALMIELVKAIRGGGLTVEGVLSQGIFEDNEKIAVEIVDLTSGSSRLMAKLAEIEQTELQYGDWSFFPEAIDWANQRLSAVQSPNVFILDEVGPLELEIGSGLQVGLDILKRGHFNLGILTARPKCIDGLKARFPDIEIYWLKSWNQETLIDKLFRIAKLTS